MQRITHSRIACAGECLKKHFWRYELCLKPYRESQPLRMGSAVHYGLELIGQVDTQTAISRAVADYDAWPPDYIDPEAWAVERHTVASLLSGYAWRWSEVDAGIETVATETDFDLPLVNPISGRPSQTFSLAGKRDKVIRYPDGRLGIRESKTTSQKLDTDSDYWGRLQMDAQTSLYWLAAVAENYPVEFVEFDVIRKPSIRLKKTENPEEYGNRLLEDIGERPDFYFARREIPRLQADLDETAGELWAWGKILRQCQLDGHWPRNTSACNRFGRCEYWSLCTSGFCGDYVPEGYVKSTRHPELESE